MAMPWLWRVPVAYLALWSLIFGLWSFFDGAAVYATFGLDLTGDPFVLMNSGARYLGVAAALVAATVLGDPRVVLVALLGRFVMDVGDFVAGIVTGQLGSIPLGLVQSGVLFFGPTALGAWLARRWLRRQSG